MNIRAWRIATASFLVLATAFALASLFVIFRQAVYIPYWDQWGWVDRYLSGETLVSLATTPINAHLVAVPALLYAIDIAWFDASNRVNLVAMMACIAGICALLRGRFAGLADAFRGTTREVYFALAVVLMLWFHNWENLFWPFQVHLYLAVLFSLASLSVLAAVAAKASGQAAGVVVAFALALLAGASFGPGLGVWAPLLVVVVLGGRPAAWKWVAALAAVLIAALLAWYLSSWVANESHPVGLLSSLEFVALYLGSPFFHGHNDRVLTTDPARLVAPLWAGYAALLLACAVVVRVLRLRKRRPLNAAELFFAGVMTFSLVAGAMAALVRGSGGAPAAALASRYGILCLLFWLSAVPLAFAGVGVARVKALAAVAPICLLAVLAASQVFYLAWWLNWRSMIDGATASLVSGVPDPEYLAYILHRPDMVERASAELMRRKLSPLYDERSHWIGKPLAEAARGAERCAADVVAPVALPAGLRFSGTVLSEGLPFGERPVFVTDAGGRIVGLGNVDRGLHGDWREFAYTRMRSWRAFAPVGEAGHEPARIFVSTGRGLCELERPGGP